MVWAVNRPDAGRITVSPAQNCPSCRSSRIVLSPSLFGSNATVSDLGPTRLSRAGVLQDSLAGGKNNRGELVIHPYLETPPPATY